MLQGLGPSSPFALPSAERLDLDQLERLVLGLLGGRGDRAARMAGWIGAVVAAPAGHFSTPDLAKVVPQGHETSEKQLRYLVDKAAWDQVTLRRALVASAPLAEVGALLLEYAEIPTGASRPGWDIFSLHAIGRGWSIPVGWQRRRIPPPNRGGQIVEISEAEQHAVCELLATFAEDLPVVEPLAAGPPPPLIGLDQRFGENAALRTDIASAVGEYLLEVGGEYVDFGPIRLHPYETRRANALLQDFFPEWSEGTAPPQPREILTGASRRGREYAVAFRREERTRYGLCRPIVSVPRGELLGRQPQERATQIAALAAEVTELNAAESLRAADFRHARDSGWERHSLLMSALQGLLTARLQAAPSPRGAHV